MLPPWLIQLIEAVLRVALPIILEEIRRPVTLEDAKPVDATTREGLDATLAHAVAAGEVPSNDA